jgi:formylmethanofuran dehydrogenase subunit E
MPVFKGDEFVGLITTKDILKIEPQLFEILAKRIELKEEENKPINVIGDNEGICESCGNYAPELLPHEGTMVCKDCRDM